MTKRKALFIFLICSLFFAYSPDSKVFAKGIKWRPVKEGMILGREEGKKIFMHFYTDWCVYCTMMREKTFKDPKVISYINKKYIPIRVDSDRKKIAGIDPVGLPDTWFLSKDGRPIANQPGFIGAKRILNILKYMYTDSYKKMGFMEFVESGKSKKSRKTWDLGEFRDSWDPRNF